MSLLLHEKIRHISPVKRVHNYGRPNNVTSRVLTLLHSSSARASCTSSLRLNIYHRPLKKENDKRSSRWWHAFAATNADFSSHGCVSAHILLTHPWLSNRHCPGNACLSEGFMCLLFLFKVTSGSEAKRHSAAPIVRGRMKPSSTARTDMRNTPRTTGLG